MRPITATALAFVSLLALPAGAPAVQVSNTAPAIGEYVKLTATVSTAGGDLMYEPSVYVDWGAGTCPGSAAAARLAAKGHFLRGMGFTSVPQGAFYGSEPVSARVLIETAQQTICFYDQSGGLADQTVVAGTPSFPAWNDNGPLKRWSLSGGDGTGISGLEVSFAGLKPLLLGGAYGIYGCNRKRFFIDPQRLHLDAGGNFSYNGRVAPDNSNNYDVPVPLKFHGIATLKLTGKIGIGQQTLKAPVTDRSDEGSFTRKGRWGHPVIRAAGSFSAPAYRAQPRAPLCSRKIRYVLSPEALSDNDPAAVMTGQGTARMATDPQSPDQMAREDAGVGSF